VTPDGAEEKSMFLSMGSPLTAIQSWMPVNLDWLYEDVPVEHPVGDLVAKARKPQRG
jgi:hypothetical protein